MTELLVRERRIAGNAEVLTSRNLKRAAEFVGLSEEIAGLRVLDMGTGVSLVVRELNERGAQAVGIDLKYRDRPTLKRSFNHNFRKIKRQYSWMNRPEVVEAAKVTGEMFFNTIGEPESQYIAASATHLPFADGVFDLALSISCHSTYFLKGKRLDILQDQTTEALRVLRAGGEFRIYPWLDSDYIVYLWEESEYNNAEKFLGWLGGRNTGYSIEGKDRTIGSYLKITRS